MTYIPIADIPTVNLVIALKYPDQMVDFVIALLLPKWCNLSQIKLIWRTRLIGRDTAKEIEVLTNQVKLMKSCLQIKLLTHQVGAAQTKKNVPTVAQTKARAAGAMVGAVELEEVKTPRDGSCLFHAVQVSTKFNDKQLRQMAAGAVVPNAHVEYNLIGGPYFWGGKNQSVVLFLSERESVTLPLSTTTWLDHFQRH